MSLSDATICNMALNHLGVSAVIANVTSDMTGEAKACRLFYDTTRDEVLGDFAWPWATVPADLQLVEADPSEEWGFSYRYPNDCLRLVRIRSGIGGAVNAFPNIVPTVLNGGMTGTGLVRHRIIRDGTGRLILCDIETAVLEYVQRITDASQYPPDFAVAFSLLLAGYVAPRLTGGDPHKLGERSLAKYLVSIGKAQANSTQQEGPDEWPMSGFEAARL